MTRSDSPIILLGAARSGTKFLRDCLAASPGVNAVPFDVNYVWRFGSEKEPDDMLNVNKLTDKTINFVRKTLPSLAKVNSDEFLIEKTVSNTLRLPYVDRIYPKARFVHLIRDGRDVTESAMRQWTEKPDTKALLTKLKSMPLQNLGYVGWYGKNMISGMVGGGRQGGKVWGPRYSGIEEDVKNLSLAEVCAWQWRHCIEKSFKDIESIDPQRIEEIRYEDLIDSPEAIRSLARKLALPDPDACANALIRNLRPNSGVPAWTKLPKQSKDDLESIVSEPLKKLGYVT